MTADDLRFADAFPKPDPALWRAAIEKVLKGADFEKLLVSRTDDGLDIQPLYHPAFGVVESDGAPGAFPFVRGTGEKRWTIEQRVDHPDPAGANATLLRDLERGVEALKLKIANPARADAGSGIVLGGAADLERLLEGVFTEMAPVSLDARGRAAEVAVYVIALWQRRGHVGEKPAGDFHVDPMATLAATGELKGGLDATMAELAAITRHIRDWPKVRSIGCDLRPYHEAGASPGVEIGTGLAAAVATMRALEAQGNSLELIASNLSFTVPVDDDVFTSMAKLRAVRLAWSLVLDGCGLKDQKAAPRVVAETSTRMLTRRDPWVNLLRNTVAGFAGAAGGADAVTVLPFTAVLGDADELARRMSRNTQLILADESHLGHVVDPAGGAWYVESLTQRLAAAAWERFREIEREGGFLESLKSGKLAARIAAQWALREKRVGCRRDPITGVSTFPLLSEQAPKLVAIDRGPLTSAAKATLSAAQVPILPLEAALAAAARGEAVLVTGGEAIACYALPLHRLSEGFELLRDTADSAFKSCGVRPQILFLNLGRLAEFNARSTWAKNLVEAGGFEAVMAEPVTGADDLEQARQASSTPIAVLCSSDERYADDGLAVAQAAKVLGIRRLYVAGRPGDTEPAWRDAGVDGFFFEGMDVLAELGAAQAFLGLKL